MKNHQQCHTNESWCPVLISVAKIRDLIMLVDSHCHLDCLDLQNHENDLQQAMAAAKANDVSHFLCVCINLEDYPKVLKIAEQFSNVYASVGVHPNETDGHEPTMLELQTLAVHSRVVAIGETGLDYYRTIGLALDNQRQRFRHHIRVARAVKKPLIIHMRDASQDTISIMQEEQASEIGGVMHCFTENWEVAQQALDLNFYISISGVVTFKNAQQIQQVATKVPLERLLIETDAPYLAPVPMRGKSNEPAYLKYTAEFIAQLRGCSYQTIAEQTSSNFFTLFRLAKK